MNRRKLENTIQTIGILGKKLLAIVSFLLAGSLLIQMPSAYQAAVHLKSKGISTTGTVVKIIGKEHYIHQTFGGYYVTRFNSTIRFKTKKGETIEFTAGDVCDLESPQLGKIDRSACKGTEFPVLYDPDNPHTAKINTGSTLAGSLLPYTFFVLLFVLIFGSAGIALWTDER